MADSRHEATEAIDIDRGEFERCRAAGGGEVAVAVGVRPLAPGAAAEEAARVRDAHLQLRHRRHVPATELLEPPQLVTYHRRRRQVPEAAHSRSRRSAAQQQHEQQHEQHEQQHEQQQRRRLRRRRRQVRHRRERGDGIYDRLPHVSSDLSALCQRRRMVVNFVDIGWKWVVAPASFDAGACSGQCPYPLSDAFNATNHALMQMILHSTRPSAANSPTCVPVSLRPRSILYVDNDQTVVLKTFDKMEVEYCGCG